MNTRKFAVFSVLFSLCLLFISHFFQWDNSAILGIDKICSDLIVIVLSLLFIKKFGLLRTAGFNSLNFIKALVLAIPFYIIGISSVFVSNVDFSSLTFISGENLLLFSLQMLLVGTNEEIWLRALILNGFLQNDNSTYKTKSILLSSLIFGLIHVPNFFFMEPLALICQIINAMAAGLLFATIFIICQNIWANILIHGIVDWLSLFVSCCFIGGKSVLSMQLNVFSAISLILAGSSVPIFFAIFYLKKFCSKDKSQ